MNDSDKPEDLRKRSPDPRIASTAELKECRLGQYADIGARVILRDVQVGDFTYFERNGEAVHTDVGKFCSIAANVRLNALDHPLNRVTTHKITYRPNEYFRFLPVDQTWRDHRRHKRVVVGDDVWIGHGAVVMPGVSVGTGAVVGANAVVTRNVEPYAIVAGVPARPLRSRFSPDVAARLLALSWWDWPVERLFMAMPDMQTLSIDKFLDKWERVAGSAQDDGSATTK